MSLDKLVLIIVSVLAGCFALVWIVAMLGAAGHYPLFGLIALAVLTLVGYIFWRIISERVGNKTEDHYDRIKH